jgi:hypothetical protein
VEEQKEGPGRSRAVLIPQDGLGRLDCCLSIPALVRANTVGFRLDSQSPQNGRKIVGLVEERDKMQKKWAAPNALSDLEEKIIVWVRAMKDASPDFPITKEALARKFGRRREEIEEALYHLDEDLGLVHPIFRHPEDLILTEGGERLADQLQGKAESPDNGRRQRQDEG